MDGEGGGGGGGMAGGSGGCVWRRFRNEANWRRGRGGTVRISEAQGGVWRHLRNEANWRLGRGGTAAEGWRAARDRTGARVADVRGRRGRDGRSARRRGPVDFLELRRFPSIWRLAP